MVADHKKEVNSTDSLLITMATYQMASPKLHKQQNI
jgi:hypothetical protein